MKKNQAVVAEGRLFKAVLHAVHTLIRIEMKMMSDPWHGNLFLPTTCWNKGQSWQPQLSRCYEWQICLVKTLLLTPYRKEEAAA